MHLMETRFQLKYGYCSYCHLVIILRALSVATDSFEQANTNAELSSSQEKPVYEKEAARSYKEIIGLRNSGIKIATNDVTCQNCDIRHLFLSAKM